MITLLSSGSYSAVTSDEPADLRKLLIEEANIRQRRINRFTQLALLGAARAVSKSSVVLDNLCGVYLASGSGQIADSCEVLQQIIKQGEEPMPLTFLNVSSNMAGFMVAQSFGLRGRNCAVNRNGMAFEAALEMALLDLYLGIVPMALVGTVEECGSSLEQQRQRLSVSADTPLLEESHWLLLGKGRGRQVERAERYHNFAAVTSAIAQLKNHGAVIATLGPLLDDEQLRQLYDMLPGINQTSAAGYSESRSVGRFIHSLQSECAEMHLYLNGCEASGYTLLALSGA